jgi:hypothetical protein
MNKLKLLYHAIHMITHPPLSHSPIEPFFPTMVF